VAAAVCHPRAAWRCLCPGGVAGVGSAGGVSAGRAGRDAELRWLRGVCSVEGAAAVVGSGGTDAWLVAGPLVGCEGRNGVFRLFVSL